MTGLGVTGVIGLGVTRVIGTTGVSGLGVTGVIGPSQ